MTVIQSLQNLINSYQVKPSTQSPLSAGPQRQVLDNSLTDYRRAGFQLWQLYSSLEKLAELMDVKTRFKLDLPDAQSTSGLGLDLTHTAAELKSTEEINATPTSFSVFGPEWNDGSSAAITIGGVYDGTHGTGTLTFEVRREGIHGVDNLRIRLEDPQGNRIKNINIRRNDPEDRQYSLDNGLFLTLGPGSLIDRDTTTIQVFDSVGAVVDPGKPLGGIRNNNPNLQFGLPAIVDGSFQINGVSIGVNTTDSISQVINRINQSNAGVTAAFNDTTEQLDFLQNTLGAAPTIDLQNDTSNFLQAMKLDGATVVAGIDPETIKPFANVGAFSGVQSGDIIINGTLIAVDAANDSLTTMIDKINASPANVIASFDPASQRFMIEARDTATVLEIDSNGTGFFAALNMVEGKLDGEALSRGFSRQRSYDIADAFTDVFENINFLFNNGSFKDRAAHTTRFRAPLEAGLGALFGDDESGSIFGLGYDGSALARTRGRLIDLDRSTLTKNLQFGGEQVKSFLAGSGEDTGLIQDLLAATRLALSNVGKALGNSGTYIDIYA